MVNFGPLLIDRPFFFRRYHKIFEALQSLFWLKVKEDSASRFNRSDLVVVVLYGGIVTRLYVHLGKC